MYFFCTPFSLKLLTYALTWSHLEPAFIINSLSPILTWSQPGANLEPAWSQTPRFFCRFCPWLQVGSRLAPGSSWPWIRLLFIPLRVLLPRSIGQNIISQQCIPWLL